jgi:hypothetical protein
MRNSALLKCSLITLATCLSGCIGSAILFDDKDQSEYGNLASVPDRPLPNDIGAYKKEIQALESDYKKAKELNKTIRDQNKLTPPQNPR